MINLLLKAIMTISLMLISINTASAVTLEVLLDQMRNCYAQMHTLEARFEQRNYQAATASTNWFSGRFYFMKPQYLRFQVSEPDNQTIIVDSSQIWIYVPVLKQLTVQPRPRDINSQTLLSMLMGVGDPRQNFNVEWYQKDVPDIKGQYRMILRPRVPQNGLDSIVVAVDSRTYYMVAFILNDRLGNRQSLELTDIRINPPLSLELFQMKTPPGTAVITPQIAPGGQP